jgi:hypothetical protein
MPTPQPTATPGGPTVTPLPTTKPIGSGFSLTSVNLYTAVTSTGGSGSPVWSYPDTQQTIYAVTTLASWQGSHTVEYDWYDPNGDPFATSTDTTGTNGATSIGTLDVAGTGASSLDGRWTLAVLLDGVLAVVEPFYLYNPASGPPSVGATTTFDSAALYNNMTPFGPDTVPVAGVTSNDSAIYVNALFDDWEGMHSITTTWVQPDGTTFRSFTEAFGDAGPTYAMDMLNLQDEDVLSHQGTWTMKVAVDGTQVWSGTFTVGS